jgi:pyruvate/2-oxoglutarate/acetoin dehydrogenase E1 component
MATKYVPEAMRDGLREEMLRDPRVIVIGEDVEVSPYGYTRGLFQEFGPARVRNTPIAETTTIGVAVGAAMCGLRPVADMMIANFLYTGMDQIANHMAKLRYMTGGQFDVPAVLIAVSGVSGNVAAQHSDAPHPVLMNLGGVRVVTPSTPSDAKGLLKTAIRMNDPVLFLVPGMVVGVKGDVPEEEYLVPFGRADIKQAGTDVTIVAIGSMVRQALRAAKDLIREGISAEVVDPCTLNPLDSDTILNSVARTGRLVVVDEAREMCSAASEIAAVVADRGFRHLKAPIRRVTAPNVPIPFSPPLENYVVPSAERIAVAVKQVIDY